MALVVMNLLAMQKIQVQSLGWEDTLEKGMATHSSVLAWRIPRTEEPDRVQFMGCKELDMTDQARMHGYSEQVKLLPYPIFPFEDFPTSLLLYPSRSKTYRKC